MPGYAELLFEKYKHKGVLIDTNLLVLLVVGSYNSARIFSFKRTLQYTLDDFALLLKIMAFFERRITTPNILTEVDNLARQLPEREHEFVAGAISQLLLNFLEVYCPSLDAVRHHSYLKLGLTDCVTLACASEILVVTDDFSLSNRISSAGLDVLNLNHIRDFDLG
jgi:hypothetical protein